MSVPNRISKFFDDFSELILPKRKSEEPLPAAAPVGSVLSSDSPYAVWIPKPVDSARDLQNNAGVRLFTCSPPIEGVSAEIEYLEKSTPLASFSLDDAGQSAFALRMASFFDGIDFASAYDRVYAGNDFPRTIFDEENVLPKRGALVRSPSERLFKLSRDSSLSCEQRLALRFFQYGRDISRSEAQALFARNPSLFSEMQEAGLIVLVNQDGEPRFRVNNLSLASQMLPGGERMYLWVELPPSLRAEGQDRPATAQFYSTGLNLLDILSEEKKRGKQYPGVVADFGAGTGLQAIALLKMHPEITQAISLEIEPLAMNLNRLNALMNGVAERTVVIDNAKPENFEAALAGRPLVLAVSNPPFNTMPHEFADRFTNFGDGGDHGIDVTKIFLAQALPKLAGGAEFLIYAQLAESKSGEFFLAKHLKESFKGVNMFLFDMAHGESGSDLESYAKLFSRFIIDHDPNSKDEDAAKTAAQMKQALEKSGVARIREKGIRLVKQGKAGKVNVAAERFFSELVKLQVRDEAKGGVRETLQPLYLDLRKHLDTPEQKGGVYLQHHVEIRREPIEKKVEVPKGEPNTQKPIQK